MGWIIVEDINSLPVMKNILVKDEYGGVANVFLDDEDDEWYIETFAGRDIVFPGEIVYYMEIPE